MASTKISQLSSLTSIADGDLLVAVDVSDASMAPTGTDKKLPLSTLFTSDGSSASGVGFRGIPHNIKSVDYVLVLTDNGKCVQHPASDNNPRTFTIPDSDSVEFPVGGIAKFQNLSAADLTVAIGGSDTLRLIPDGTTGPITLGQYDTLYAEYNGSGLWLASFGGGGSIIVEGTANQITASEADGTYTISLPSVVVLPGTMRAVTSGTIGASGTANFHFQINTAAGSMLIQDTGTAPDYKKWAWQTNGGALIHSLYNDAESVTTQWMVVNRVGTTVANVTFPNGLVGIGATPNDASIKCRIDSTTSAFRKPTMTVAQMNAISSPLAGAEVNVTDSNATHATLGVGAAITGGGANLVPAIFNGSAWRTS